VWAEIGHVPLSTAYVQVHPEHILLSRIFPLSKPPES
jgi:hypothetical protein